MQAPILAAFDQGQVPTIAVVNKSTLPVSSWKSGGSLLKLVAALQKFANLFAAVWGTPCRLVRAADFLPDAWAIVFTDDADQAGALGYHDTTPAGLPLSHVFVKTTLADGGPVSITASHELAEMLVDPAINLAAFGPYRGSSGKTVHLWYALETGDAVEQEAFPVNGVPMSDFVYPAWFQPYGLGGKYDHLGRCTRPFQILPGGYMPVMYQGRWQQVYGSAQAKARRALQDRRLHRSDRRLSIGAQTAATDPLHDVAL